MQDVVSEVFETEEAASKVQWNLAPHSRLPKKGGSHGLKAPST